MKRIIFYVELVGVLMFALAAIAGEWSYSSWTDDTTAGIDNQDHYTCSVNMYGSAVTVNGVDFEAYAGASGTGWSIGGSIDTHASLTTHISGDGATLANNGFIYKGNPRTVTLSGLTSGKPYITTFFAYAFGAPGDRVQTFVSGSDSFVADQNTYGSLNGIRIEYSFIADAATREFSITPHDSGNTFHMSALANHEVPTPFHYVSPTGTRTAPFDTWETAANTIQAAVDVATAGDTVRVTNGTYTLTSEITVTKAITVESVNGCDVTLVDGQDAHRCFHLSDSACTLRGFTIENGKVVGSHYDVFEGGGGVRCNNNTPVIANCILTGNSADNGGGCWRGTLNNCTLSGNSADFEGGGCCGGTLNSCILIDNSAGMNGGGVGSVYLTPWSIDSGGFTLNNCTLISNTADNGGGCGRTSMGCAPTCRASNCILTGNSASGYGGGSFRVAMNNCTISCNSAVDEGGGCFSCWLTNCVISGNSANEGGGVGEGSMSHCTVIGNAALTRGGGVGYQSTNNDTIENCIIWNNTAQEDPNCELWTGEPFSYCCTSPLLPGIGNITNAPIFADAIGHLFAGSPCIDAGTNLTGMVINDMDGTQRPLDGNGDGSALPDIGAYEFFNPASDTDGDGLTDEFERDTLGTSMFNPNCDGDAATDYEEYVAGTDCYDCNDYFHIVSCTGRTVWFQSSSNRVYTLLWCLDFDDGNPYWGTTRDQTRIPGSGGIDSLTDPYDDPSCFYRVQVELP